MQRFVLPLVCLFAMPALATGFGSDAPPSRIPIPARDFRVTFEDHGGTVLDVDRVTFNGEVFLYGAIGAAQVTVPFEKIAKIEFTADPAEDRRKATATTKDGQRITVLVDDDLPCYGRTKFGNYSIEVSDIRRITFR